MALPTKKTPRPKDSKINFVYCIAGGDWMKIGFSCDPYKRLNTLQTGFPIRLDLRASREFPGIPQAKAFEKRMHKKFARHKLRGEWFDIVALDAVKKILNGE
jgi:hypothetical protein